MKCEYFTRGIHYYITARYAAFAGFTPVCGNLFHHAIEMFLKGYLAHLEEVELRKLGHRLTEVWDTFKKNVADATLDRFDRAVADLNQFESIRYPERMLAEGMLSAIDLVPWTPAPGFTTTVKEPVYRLERFLIVRSTAAVVLLPPEEPWRRTRLTCGNGCCEPGISVWTPRAWPRNMR